MTASYAMRLLLQCLSSAFLVHLVIGLAVYAITPIAVRFADRLPPASGARLLFGLRLLPLTVAIYVAFALTIPSYLRLEPESEFERVGLRGAWLALAAVAVWLRPSLRVFRAVHQSRRFLGTLQEQHSPCVVVSGLLKPRVLISQAARNLFPPDELDVVLRHEVAHGRSHDNLKRLFWLMLPDAFPFVGLFSRIERAHHRLIEWAADDFAVAGGTHEAISLAHALITFARAWGRVPGGALVSGLVDNNVDLARRVERLLNGAQHAQRAVTAVPAFLAVTAGAVCATGTVLANLGPVHGLLELLSR